jgi:hypothetical protein
MRVASFYMHDYGQIKAARWWASKRNREQAIRRWGEGKAKTPFLPDVALAERLPALFLSKWLSGTPPPDTAGP